MRANSTNPVLSDVLSSAKRAMLQFPSKGFVINHVPMFKLPQELRNNSKYTVTRPYSHLGGL
jgi:hypothetical protein